MKKILFFGDSITDMERNKEWIKSPYGMGEGYVFVIKSKLSEMNPIAYDITNMGISGNRIVDLYSRIKKDCWNYEPDLISILIGVNDIWHEGSYKNGVEPERFDKIYRMLIDDTKKRLPNVKFIILEPFVLDTNDYGEIQKGIVDSLPEYRKIVRKIAIDYDIPFVELQEKFDDASKKYDAKTFLYDGIHPDVAGSTLIANEWIKVFKTFEKDI